MTQVLLRDCIEDLRGHLRAGRYSDALALGRHVLNSFPRHLETYRLLAETHLELNELDAATDLYNRLRSADPESVAALIGLSVVHERRGETDEAVWHLERAFEIQPSNAELRRELARLSPSGESGATARAKLPPSGLARLYARQGLNAQAIREFRALLRADPGRLDLQVALIQVLFREGQLQEAARGAQSILQSLPYCLKANLILGKLWSDNGVPEGEELLKLARSLDPELLMAREMQIDLGEFAPPTLPAPEGIAITAAPVSPVSLEPAAAAPEEEPGTSGPFESPEDVESLEALFGTESRGTEQAESPLEPSQAAEGAAEESVRATSPNEEPEETAIPWLQSLELPESESEPTGTGEIAPAQAEIGETRTAAEEQAALEHAQPQAELAAVEPSAALTEESAPPISAQMPFEEGLTQAVAPDILTAEPVPVQLSAEPPRSHPAEPPAAVAPPELAEEKPAAPVEPEPAPAVPTFLRIEGAEPAAAESAPEPAPPSLQQEAPQVIEEATASAIAPFAQPAAVPPDETTVEPEGGLSLLWTVEELFPQGSEHSAAEEPAAAEAQETPPPAPSQAEAAPASEPPPESPAEPIPAVPAAPIAGDEGTGPPAREPAPAPSAPSRRVPAIPTVAPTIPGALNKLPVWLLRFITRRPSDVIPLPAPAPAPRGNGSAVTSEPEVDEDEDEVLPDWLAAIQAGQTKAAADEATHVRIAQRDAEAEADQEDLPTWLRDEPVPATGGTAPVGTYSAPAGGGRRRVPAPDWLDAAGYAAESVSPPETPPSFAPTPGQQSRRPPESSSAWSAQSGLQPPASPDAPELTAEEQAELPDWLRAPPAAPGQAASATATEEQPANELVAPDPEAMLEQARQRAAEGRHAEALDLYEKIIHRGPRHVQAAVADLEALVRQPGAPSTSHRVLGDAYAMTGRFKEAIEQYRQVLSQ